MVEYDAPAPTMAYRVPETTMTLPATVHTQPVAMVPIDSATVLPTTYGALEFAAPAPAVYATHGYIVESTAPAPAVHAAPAYVAESTAPATAVYAAQVRTLTEVEDDAVADESGFESEDIKLVMSHVSCPRPTAVSALRANINDIMEAIDSDAGREPRHHRDRREANYFGRQLHFSH